jgi:hypothetical protein
LVNGIKNPISKKYDYYTFALMIDKQGNPHYIIGSWITSHSNLNYELTHKNWTNKNDYIEESDVVEKVFGEISSNIANNTAGFQNPNLGKNHHYEKNKHFFVSNKRATELVKKYIDTDITFEEYDSNNLKHLNSDLAEVASFLRHDYFLYLSTLRSNIEFYKENIEKKEKFKDRILKTINEYLQDAKVTKMHSVLKEEIFVKFYEEITKINESKSITVEQLDLLFSYIKSITNVIRGSEEYYIYKP